jgi:hypothetical protein
MKKQILSGVLCCLIAACARLDHVQISDIDQRQGQLQPISVKLSEAGIHMANLAHIGSELSSSVSTSEHLDGLKDILQLINMGPSTGNPVFSDTYAEQALQQLYAQCPTGKITGIRSIREANDYGVVSGEIIRLDAFCII